MRFSNSICFCLLTLLLLLRSLAVGAQQCGSQAGGKLCPEGFCCSEWGYCGNTIDYCCGSKCQSQCSGCPSPPPPYVPPPPPPPYVSPPPPSPECPHPSTGLEVCGCQAGGKKCREGLCCSEWGYCGCEPEFCCGSKCQSQCSGCPSPPPPYTPPPPSPPPSPTPPGSVAILINETLFNDMLKHKDNCLCPAEGFYTYDAFIKVAESYPGFAKTGSDETRKREIAAFLAQTSHETNGGWKGAPDGEYAWGYCFKEEENPTSDYCNNAYTQWPCASGKKYFGRGPIQISWNYNYGPAGEALGYKLLDDPDAVARDPVISFETAIWFWMTPQSPKPSCHQVITGQWEPTEEDIKAGRLPGYGVTTNIINGLLECGQPGPNDQVENRIGYYKTYCDKYSISYGDNLDCYGQQPFGLSSVQLLENMHEDSAVAEF